MNQLLTGQTDWTIFQRVQEVNSEFRVNILRAIAVASLFALVLVSNASGSLEAIDVGYVWKSYVVCFVWILLCGVIAGALKLKVAPPILKYVTTLCDVLLLTTIASIGDKAESTLVIVYFLIIAATYLRYSYSLVVFGSVACIFGYLTLVNNTPQFWARTGGGEFPSLEVFRTLVGLLLMMAIGWYLDPNVSGNRQTPGPEGTAGSAKDGVRSCPKCRKSLGAKADTCWVCYTPLSPQTGPVKSASPSPPVMSVIASNVDSPARSAKTRNANQSAKTGAVVAVAVSSAAGSLLFGLFATIAGVIVGALLVIVLILSVLTAMFESCSKGCAPHVLVFGASLVAAMWAAVTFLSSLL